MSSASNKPCSQPYRASPLIDTRLINGFRLCCPLKAALLEYEIWTSSFLGRGVLCLPGGVNFTLAQSREKFFSGNVERKNKSKCTKRSV